MTNKDIASIIFPEITHTIGYYEEKYPKRELGENARVTRFAPSPTGFVHIGNFMPALIDYVMAKRTGGVNFLRNEDTDKKREIDEAMGLILQTLNYYGISPDEYEHDGIVRGDYGPYVQSRRAPIYHAYIKHLVEIGRAYPCFCARESLDETRREQEANKLRTGYYAEYARCRDVSNDQRAEKLKAGASYVIRFKSGGDYSKRFKFTDEVKGELELPENDQDIVIMKSDNRLPTYHFAHVVDDWLMRTTHVVRGEEWLPSVPIHIELFAAFGFTPPRYAHNPLILKKDGDGVRKISKRKDPEALMNYYIENGYPAAAVIDSIMSIVNSNYEQWRSENRKADFLEFGFDAKKMSVSGAFYSLAKLDDISKTIISEMTSKEIAELSYEWSKIYRPSLCQTIEADSEYYENILAIERDQPKPRKDIAKYGDIEEYIWFMYDDIFEKRNPEYEWQKITDSSEINSILKLYTEKYLRVESKDDWFGGIKELSGELGYASNNKEYKAEPEKYKGTLSDVATVLRVAITSKATTFDLYEIIRLMGKDRIAKRFSKLAH